MLPDMSLQTKIRTINLPFFLKDYFSRHRHADHIRFDIQFLHGSQQTIRSIWPPSSVCGEHHTVQHDLGESQIGTCTSCTFRIDMSTGTDWNCLFFHQKDYLRQKGNTKTIKNNKKHRNSINGSKDTRFKTVWQRENRRAKESLGSAQNLDKQLVVINHILHPVAYGTNMYSTNFGSVSSFYIYHPRTS